MLWRCFAQHLCAKEKEGLTCLPPHLANHAVKTSASRNELMRSKVNSVDRILYNSLVAAGTRLWNDRENASGKARTVLRFGKRTNNDSTFFRYLV